MTRFAMVKVSGIWPNNPTFHAAFAARHAAAVGRLVMGEKSDTTISFKTLGP
jgi:hypothetical protein